MHTIVRHRMKYYERELFQINLCTILHNLPFIVLSLLIYSSLFATTTIYGTFLLHHICLDLMTRCSMSPTRGLQLCCQVTFAYLSSFICPVTFLECHRSKIHRTLPTHLLRNCNRSGSDEGFLFTQLFTQSQSEEGRHWIFSSGHV